MANLTSQMCIVLQLAFLQEIEGFKDYLSICQHQTSLRNKP